MRYHGTGMSKDVMKRISHFRETHNRLNEMIQTQAKKHNEWLEREILGAWISGYDYLHYVKSDIEYCYPSNSKKLNRDGIVQTYDLRWLFPDDVEAWRNGEI